MIYLGNYVYDWNSNLQYVLTADGRLVPDNKQLRMEYFMKDHLGNTRATYAQAAPGQAQVAEYNHYYPFGMLIEDISYQSGADAPNYYLYNGKELQKDYGLEWLDYGFRLYDPAISRYHVQDPRAEKYFNYSLYNYCLNNPWNLIDPRGDTVKFAGATEEATYNDYKNIINTKVQAYDKKTQNLRDNGKTKRADKRDARRSDNVYVQIQTELSAAESNENIFRLRMGSNISNSAGDGNISYNKCTSEIDVNIAAGGEWTTIQKVSHEFKHIDQFINLDLDLNPDGGGGLFYDKTDEVAAFERQNLFGTPVNAKSFVDENYSDRREGPKSFHLLTPSEKVQYKTLKYIYNGKK